MEHHHLLRHSKQQAAQGTALAGVALIIFGIYVAFAFAATYYEKSVTLLSQLPLKQQTLMMEASRVTPPVSKAARVNGNLANQYLADVAGVDTAKVQLQLKQYNLDGQASLLVFAFAMYKIAIIISCSLIFFGSAMVWAAYHGWWSFTKKHDATTSGSPVRAVVKRPTAVVRRKTSR